MSSSNVSMRTAVDLPTRQSLLLQWVTMHPRCSVRSTSIATASYRARSGCSHSQQWMRKNVIR